MMDDIEVRMACLHLAADRWRDHGGRRGDNFVLGTARRFYEFVRDMEADERPEKEPGEFVRYSGRVSLTEGDY